MKKLFYYILLLKVTFSFSQVFNTDLEKFNLKGNVKYIYYEKLNLKNDLFFEYNSAVTEYNYYFYFDLKGNLESYGKFKNDTINKEIVLLSKTLVKNKENTILRDALGRIIDVQNYFYTGYYKNKISSKTSYEYPSDHDLNYKITNYKTFIDTTDLGVQYLNHNPKKFDPEKHTLYHLYKDDLLCYNSKKQLLKKYIYFRPDDFVGDNFKNKYDELVEFEYNLNGDISKITEYRAEWMKFPNIELFKYQYDKMNNWIISTILCNKCENEKVIDILYRKIVYWE